MTKDEALTKALGALYDEYSVDKAISAIKEALAQPDQSCYCANCEALSKQLAQREWVGLMEDEVLQIGVATGLDFVAVRMIEAKLKEKNA